MGNKFVYTVDLRGWYEGAAVRVTETVTAYNENQAVLHAICLSLGARRPNLWIHGSRRESEEVRPQLYFRWKTDGEWHEFLTDHEALGEVVRPCAGAGHQAVPADTPLSDLADSLRGEGDTPFKLFLLAQLSHAESRVQDRDSEEPYWQGRKDALRLVLAEYMNAPELAALNTYSTMKRRMAAVGDEVKS